MGDTHETGIDSVQIGHHSCVCKFHMHTYALVRRELRISTSTVSSIHTPCRHAHTVFRFGNSDGKIQRTSSKSKSRGHGEGDGKPRDAAKQVTLGIYISRQIHMLETCTFVHGRETDFWSKFCLEYRMDPESRSSSRSICVRIRDICSSEC